ncbi:MAG: AraC family transcriptional regulator [Proteobacteria bacterium]|nr:AraC family transcriptional regulator [Pseudomonadota bacterium]
MNARPSPTRLHAPLRYLELLSRAASHVNAHLDTDLDAQDLAQRAAMSRHHFHRIFHAYFGLTVGGYLGWRRLRRACELLAEPGASVLDVAQSVGFASAQALAKAMRRELDATPTDVRAGFRPDWDAYFQRRRIPDSAPACGESAPPLHPRWTAAPAFDALCATGRGMHAGTMVRAAGEGFGQLLPALEAANLTQRLTHCIAAMPEEPQGPQDAHCRIWCGAVFGLRLPDAQGESQRPRMGRRPAQLHWRHWPAGRYAVFTHAGPYDGLHNLWKSIYRHWVPATGFRLRDVPGFDLYLNDPRETPPEQLRTELYLPVE